MTQFTMFIICYVSLQKNRKGVPPPPFLRFRCLINMLSGYFTHIYRERRRHCQRRVAQFRPILGGYDLLAGREPHRTTPQCMNSGNSVGFLAYLLLTGYRTSIYMYMFAGSVWYTSFDTLYLRHNVNHILLKQFVSFISILFSFRSQKNLLRIQFC